MGLYVWKFPFRKILMPLAKALKDVNPDILSYLAVVVALVTGFCFYFSGYNSSLLIVAIILTFLRMTLNTLDGVIAIEKGNLRLEGEIVNALPDRYSDIFVMLGIAFSSYCNIYLGTIAAISVILVSYSGMLGKAIGVSWQHQGPLGKVERLILIMVAALLQYILTAKGIQTVKISFFKFTVIEFLMLWFIFGAQITVFNRVRAALREIRRMRDAK